MRVPAASWRDAASEQAHTIGLVLLSCGHPEAVIIHPGKSVTATLKKYDWECPNTSTAAAVARVLAVLSVAEFENLTDDALDTLVSTGA